MTEAIREHLFVPPPQERKKSTFTRVLKTQSKIYDRKWGIPQEVSAGLEVEIEGISWQQVASERDPKRYPDDLWVEVTVVSPNNTLSGRKMLVTMGTINRLSPEEKRRRSQEKQRELSRRAAKGPKKQTLSKDKKQPPRVKEVEESQLKISAEPKLPQAEVEAESGSKEEFTLWIFPRARLFDRHPRPRAEGETKEQRKEYLDETTTEITNGRINITVKGNRKEIWANDDHWFEGEITMLTNRDMEYLELGQKVFISKGEASRRPKKK
ncbi:hypothetical protein KKG52_02565 [Patescibacteria group bacterium]|nr:hypothetical protein [Patescibacteria group bacterium]